MEHALWLIISELFFGIESYFFAKGAIIERKKIIKRICMAIIAFCFPLCFLWMVITGAAAYPAEALGISLLLLNTAVLGTINGLLHLERIKGKRIIRYKDGSHGFKKLNRNDDRIFKKMILYIKIASCITVVACIAALCIENIYARLSCIFMNIVLGVVWYKLFKKYY